MTPGTLEGFGIVSVPLDITGGPSQLALFTANVSFVSMTLDAPFTSTLTPTGNPNEWLWAALASVTLSGELEPIVSIPSVQDVTLGSFPFTQSVTIPLAGTFSGSLAGTEVTVGIPPGVLEDTPLPLPPINVNLPLDPLQLGLVTGFFNLDGLTLAEFTADVVYRNSSVPIPEPSTALLVGVGLAGLVLRRRTRAKP
jgi:hypothetical protein